MITVKCQYTGLEFEAKSKRSKNHPDVAALLAEANKRSVYGVVVQALTEARDAGIEPKDVFEIGRVALREGIEASNKFADELRAARKQRAAERAQERKDFYASLDEEQRAAADAASFEQRATVEDSTVAQAM